MIAPLKFSHYNTTDIVSDLSFSKIFIFHNYHNVSKIHKHSFELINCEMLDSN